MVSERIDLDLARLIAHFPEHGRLISRLAATDESFRHVCEDLALARAALRRFEAEGEHGADRVAAEYRTLVAELESELERALHKADRA